MKLEINLCWLASKTQNRFLRSDRLESPRSAGHYVFFYLLHKLVNPESVGKRAKADQLARIDELGGIDIIASVGVFSASPIPGKAAEIEVTASKKI